MAMMDTMSRIPDYLRTFRETRLSRLRPASEFFNIQAVSRPADLNEATSRITHNARIFSGNYGVIVAILTVYALLTNTRFLFALAFLFGGFVLINRFGTDPVEIGNAVVTQKSLYTALFVIGIPLLWFSDPLGSFFWLVGSSAILILGHAALLEPGVESEYGVVEGAGFETV